MIRRLVALVFALALAGCATAERYDAAGDIHNFLIAVRDGDRAVFDAHVDRPALKANLKARLLATTAGRYGLGSAQTAGAMLAQPLVDLAVDALVRPQVFKAAAELAGYGPDIRIPGGLALGQKVRPIGSDTVCAIIKDRCAFVFKHEDGTWRLIDFEGDLALLNPP